MRGFCSGVRLFGVWYAGTHEMVGLWDGMVVGGLQREMNGEFTLPVRAYSPNGIGLTVRRTNK